MDSRKEWRKKKKTLKTIIITPHSLTQTHQIHTNKHKIPDDMRMWCLFFFIAPLSMMMIIYMMAIWPPNTNIERFSKKKFHIEKYICEIKSKSQISKNHHHHNKQKWSTFEFRESLFDDNWEAKVKIREKKNIYEFFFIGFFSKMKWLFLLFNGAIIAVDHVVVWCGVGGDCWTGFFFLAFF